MSALSWVLNEPSPSGPAAWNPPDTGVPWLDLALWVAVVVVLTFCFLIMIFHRLAFKPLKEMVKSIKEDAAVTREQTENSHASSKTPNLRDDMDYKHSENRRWNENIARMIARMEETARASQARTDKELSRINDTLLDDREATRDVAKKLDAHIEQKLGFEQRITVVESKLDSHREVTEAP